MKVAIGFDHAGFPLKKVVLDAVREAGHEPIDLGTNSADPVDFPDYSEKVGRAVQRERMERSASVPTAGRMETAWNMPNSCRRMMMGRPAAKTLGDGAGDVKLGDGTWGRHALPPCVRGDPL